MHSRETVNSDEIAADENLAVRLQLYFSDADRNPCVKAGIDRSVSIQTSKADALDAARDDVKAAADQDFIIRLNFQTVNNRVRRLAERRIDRAVGIEPADADLIRISADVRKPSDDHDLAVGLQIDIGNRVVRAGGQIEGRIQSSVAVEAGNSVSRRRADLIKLTDD